MLLNVIINWYGECSAVVRWESSLSRCFFSVTSGVCQGGVLSPFLFAIYVDDGIVNLHNKRLAVADPGIDGRGRLRGSGGLPPGTGVSGQRPSGAAGGRAPAGRSGGEAARS